MRLPPPDALIAATTLAIVAGSLLDRLIGDPRRMPHLVRGIGRLIATVERWLRPRPQNSTPPTPPDSPSAQVTRPVDAPVLTDRRSRTASRDRRRGTILVIAVIAVAGSLCAAVLVVAYAISIWLGSAVEAVICFQCLAVKCLRDESGAVRSSLEVGDLPQARRDVAMIVGRDTADLDEAGVARAGVETVAENTADGVIAPLLAMFLVGGLGAVVYKAVNTMDSMIGYRDERYLHFGRTAARLDDVVNWAPSRIAAVLMVVAARLTGLDWRGAWRVWRRDHGLHASPNSAQTESACAGALGIELGGPATYHGEHHDKPVIGAPGRGVVARDITDANRLMSVTAWLALIGVVLVRAAIWGVVAHVL